MRLTRKKVLEKLKRKNLGNESLANAINNLIKEIEDSNWENPKDLISTRPDADCVHSDGFYFFNITAYRTMILIEFGDKEATIVWAGNHQDYRSTFRNNKHTIRKWLRSNNWI